MPLYAYYVKSIVDLPEYSVHYKSLDVAWFRQAKEIGKILNITINMIDETSLRKFSYDKKNIITDSPITDVLDDTLPIILQSSNSYCGFGFDNRTWFPITKHKLERAWQSALNLKNRKKIYTYRQQNVHSNYNNLYVVDSKKILRTFNLLDKCLSASFKSNITLKSKLNYLLVLPPSVGCDSKFYKEFFRIVNFIAGKEKLEVIVKPHRNNKCSYSNLVNKKKIIDLNQSNLKFVCVEFLFLETNIKKIISVPSSSLAFADSNKILVLMPKNRREFRTRYLDQLPFLDCFNLSYERV